MEPHFIRFCRVWVSMFLSIPQSPPLIPGATFLVSTYSDPWYCPLWYIKSLGKRFPSCHQTLICSSSRRKNTSIPNLFALFWKNCWLLFRVLDAVSLAILSGPPCPLWCRPIRIAFSNREIRQTWEWSSDAAGKYMRRQNVGSLSPMMIVHAPSHFS